MTPSLSPILFSSSVPPRILHTTPVAVPNYRDDVSVDCKATGSPRPIISWWNRNKPLSLSNKYSIFHNGTLVIHQTTPLDTGAYFCRAANIIGHSQGRSFVLVRTWLNVRLFCNRLFVCLWLTQQYTLFYTTFWSWCTIYAPLPFMLLILFFQFNQLYINKTCYYARNRKMIAILLHIIILKI